MLKVMTAAHVPLRYTLSFLLTLRNFICGAQTFARRLRTQEIPNNWEVIKVGTRPPGRLVTLINYVPFKNSQDIPNCFLNFLCDRSCQMSSKYINLEAQGVEVWEGRTDGKKKKGKEV